MPEVTFNDRLEIKRKAATFSIKKVFQNFSVVTGKHQCWNFSLIKLHASNGCFWQTSLIIHKIHKRPRTSPIFIALLLNDCWNNVLMEILGNFQNIHFYSNTRWLLKITASIVSKIRTSSGLIKVNLAV